MPSLTRSFGLMDLTACAAIVVMLVSLSLGGWHHAQTTHSRTDTVFSHADILRGLEDYKTANGDYPLPAHPDATAVIDGKTYRIGGAMMLYQILGADGSDEIAAPSAAAAPVQGKPSNGSLADEGKVSPLWSDLVASPRCWRVIDGHYILVDDFGHPFQYEKGGSPNAVNATFDAWSIAEDNEAANDLTLDLKKNPGVTARWIRNF